MSEIETPFGTDGYNVASIPAPALSGKKPPVPDPNAANHKIRFDPHTGGKPALKCTCGWTYTHTRAKVFNKALTKHQEKTGHIWSGMPS